MIYGRMFHDFACDNDDNDRDVEGPDNDAVLSFWVMRQRMERWIHDKAAKCAGIASNIGAAQVRVDGEPVSELCLAEVDLEAELREDDFVLASENASISGTAAGECRDEMHSNKVEEKTALESYLTRRQIQSLDSLGLYWGMDIRAPWIRNFRRLCAFRRRTGNCRITRGSVSPELYRFVSSARSQYKATMEVRSSPHIQEKIRLLQSIDFVFELDNLPSILGWDQRYEMLQNFHSQHGHCLVPQKHPTLGDWVKKMRQAYEYRSRGVKAKGSRQLSDENIAKLEELRFVWRVRPGRSPAKLKGGDFEPSLERGAPGRGNNRKRQALPWQQQQTNQEGITEVGSTVPDEGKRLGEVGHELDQITMEKDREETNFIIADKRNVSHSTDGDSSERKRSALDWVYRKGSSRRSRHQPQHQFFQGVGGEEAGQMATVGAGLCMGQQLNNNVMMAGSPSTDLQMQPQNPVDVPQPSIDSGFGTGNMSMSEVAGQQPSVTQCELCKSVTFCLSGCIPCGHKYCGTCLELVISGYGRRCAICSSFVSGTSDTVGRAV